MAYSVLGAYALLVGFTLWERRSRRSAEAERFDRGAHDRGSTLLIGGVFGLGFILLPLSLLLTVLQVGSLGWPAAVGWGGVAVMALGVGLRVWSNQVLAAYYTRTLRVAPGQRVVSDGPYRVVRHPGYLGSVLLWVGAAVATLNGITLTCLALAAVAAYLYRIRVEETMLQATLGEPYRAYMTRTWRILPFVY